MSQIMKTCVIAVILSSGGLAVADVDTIRADVDRIGRFLTLTSPINDTQVARVGNLAVELQTQAEREQKEAVLVLEIPAGSSSFGQVSDLARRLTAADVSQVRTVAWIPRTVDGYHAILALACHDVVMKADASLGDIGRGQAVPEEERDFILSIVNRRRNSRLSRGVVQAMMDPSVELLRVRMEGAAGLEEQRFVTPAELKTLQDRNTVISETDTIKDIGAPGLFNAADAQRAGFLVARTLDSRRDVATLYNLPTESLRESGAGDSPVVARLIAIHEPITLLTEEFILRQIRTSVAEGANVLIFDIDSPGGYLDSTKNIANTIARLDPAKVTTVSWIKQRALSGAAIISLAADHLVMSPDAEIGDAGVIQETAEGGAFERAEEKVTSELREYMKTLGERKNRPSALLEAMIDRNLKVYQVTHAETGRITYMSDLEIEDSSENWVKGPLVPESREGFLLTVNGRRAHELGLADAPAGDLGAVRLRFGIPEGNVLEPAARTWVDTFVFVLTTQIAGFGLITLAILCIYLELHLPSGFFGIVSLVLFSLFFWSRYLGGTSGSLELIMFLLGIGLLALEIFVIPGFGVFGVSGILLMTGSLVMASHTFAGLTAGERFNESMSSLGSLAGALCTVIVVAMVLNRFLPSIPFVNRLILTPPGQATVDEEAPHLNPAVFSSNRDDGPVSVGEVGVAASTLRPSGKASFGEHFLDVVSDGAYIDHGTPIEVIRVAGNRIIVRPTEESDDGLTQTS
ncbi:MAG: NfeD family protein [Fuerstiella sp.]